MKQRTHWKFDFLDKNNKKITKRFGTDNAGHNFANRKGYEITWAIELPGPIPKTI